MARRSRAGLGFLAIAAAVGLLTSGPAGADWLVTRDGSAVETRGGWNVKGRLIVFHTADGTFSSMRLDQVDLEASEARTRAAAEAAAAPRPIEAPAPRPKAKFVLTDDDVGHVDPAAIPDPRDRVTVEAAKEGDLVPPDQNPLEVVDWSAVVGAGADGVTISGDLRNPTSLHAANIRVEITLLDLAGAVIGERFASLAATALNPGEIGGFQAFFPGIFSVGDARFAISSFNSEIPEPPAPDEDESPGV